MTLESLSGEHWRDELRKGTQAIEKLCEDLEITVEELDDETISYLQSENVLKPNELGLSVEKENLKEYVTILDAELRILNSSTLKFNLLPGEDFGYIIITPLIN